MKIATDAAVISALEAGAPVAIGVSGGKDSQAAVIATLDHLATIGHSGPVILVHADLGSVEWNASHEVCEKMAARFGLELVTVARKAGGLMERWESRWQSSRQRYETLQTVTLVPCWSTPSMRFCTSELKTHVITAELKRRFPGQTVVNVTGVRREESAARAKQPISDVKPGLVNWRPILDWTIEEVFGAIDASGMEPHEAYRNFGMTRVSCRFCIMSSLPDLIAAALQPESHDLFRRMVALEAESSFAFQGARWLGDIAPQLLDAGGAAALAAGKERAAERKRLEAMIPKDLLYVSGWPVRIPDADGAELIAGVRREISRIFGFDSLCLDAKTVIERHEELMADKHLRETGKADVLQRRAERSGRLAA